MKTKQAIAFIMFFLFFAEARSQDVIRIDTVSYSYYNTVFNGYTHVKSYQITNISDKECLTWVSDTPTKGKSASVLVHEYFIKRKNDFSYIQWMHEEDFGRPISNWTIGTSFLKRIMPNEVFSYIIVKNNDSLVMYDEKIVVISKDEVERCIGGTTFSFDESLFFPFSSICLSDGALEINTIKTAVDYRQLPILSIENENLIPLIDSVVRFYDNIEQKSDSLFITISTSKRPGQEYSILLISSDEHRITIFDGIRDPIGCFYYKNYLFVVYEKESAQFFSPTNTKKSFPYDPHIKDKPFVIDDTHPYWVYYYHNGETKLLGESIPPEYSPQRNDE